jgi:hypothetical protein
MIVMHHKNSCCVENCKRDGDHALIVKTGETKIIAQVCKLCKKLIESEEEFSFSTIPLKNHTKKKTVLRMR